MAGGDVHVRVNKNAYGLSPLNSVIDANTKASGNMQTPVQVNGRTVYMTEGGAARYNMLKDNSFGTLKFSVHDDTRTGGGFLGLFADQVSNVPRGHEEGFLGNPDQE
jgi:hypothetical protein